MAQRTYGRTKSGDPTHPARVPPPVSIAIANPGERSTNTMRSGDTPPGAFTPRVEMLFVATWRQTHHAGRCRQRRLANKKAPLSGAFLMRPRGLEPPRTIQSTRPSTLRVYQFRHRR